MNVLCLFTTATQMQLVPTLMDLSYVIVTEGTLEMGHFVKVCTAKKKISEGLEGVKWELGFIYFWLGQGDFMHCDWDSSAIKQMNVKWKWDSDLNRTATRHYDDGICALCHWDLVKILAGKWEKEHPVFMTLISKSHYILALQITCTRIAEPFLLK